MENFIEALFGLYYSTTVVITSIIIIYIINAFANWRTTTFDDYKEILNGNMAVAFRRSGLLFGFSLAFCGIISGLEFSEEASIFVIIGLLVGYSSLSGALLFTARQINDSLVLHGINNDDACKENIISVSIVEIGMYIATGLVICASAFGEGGGWISLVLFFILGQLILLTMTYLYEKITPINIVDEIKKGNTSAAIQLASILISIGIILAGSIAGPSQGLIIDIYQFCVSGIIGIILLCATIIPIDKIFMPRISLFKEISSNKNVSIAINAGCLHIITAIIISATLIKMLF